MLSRLRSQRITTRHCDVSRVGVFGMVLAAVTLIVGCGTTRMSDTLRTGTEQILLSAAIDRSISEMDFSILNGKDVFFDAQYLKGVSDEGYIVSSIRQKLLAEGVFLKATRDEATYVVEARAGAVGTNRQDVLVGIPQTNVPTGLAVGAPSVIPEIPFAKNCGLTLIRGKNTTRTPGRLCGSPVHRRLRQMPAIHGFWEQALISEVRFTLVQVSRDSAYPGG